ncbi:hypothetical protein TI39_contig4515g00001 [Zymoseptoria brevis]|uniref:Trichothecene 3-o-acetyltransferase like protein n=1 Tax=Zymoseptoria brevis TaxID=1047168 RepID=A0A0F4G6G5_9PEZI|nr:hypothetical protein TI39_contig4515g00001 [Zymoseptoria brevis]
MDSTKVYPKEPVPCQKFKLSLSDVYAPKHWVVQSHFLPLKTDVSFARCYEILKTGLSRTVSDIPALLGTIQQLSDDPRDLAIEVEDDSYVEFLFEDFSARQTVPRYDQLKAIGFSAAGLLKSFAPPVAIDFVSEGSRILAAKLNYLSGGIVLTVGINHLFADAATVSRVEQTWACHTADVSRGCEKSYRIDVPDAEIRERLSKPPPGTTPTSSELWKVVPAAQSPLRFPEKIATDKGKEAGSIDSSTQAIPPVERQADDIGWSIWHLSPESLTQLKHAASAGDGEDWISTIDAVAGLFWCTLASEMQWSKTGYGESLVFFALNIRHRLEPAIHPQYLGNAVDMVTGTSRVEDLVRGEQSLHGAARAIRNAVQSWDQTEWARRLALMTVLPKEEALCPDVPYLLSPNHLGFVDSSKVRTQFNDWGADLGHVERTRYILPVHNHAKCATILNIHPQLSDGGLEVAITLSAQLRDALQSNLMFARFVSLVCVDP